jgi:hypothetical protein
MSLTAFAPEVQAAFARLGAAAWEMVSEQRAMRGDDGDEPRLQRSIVRVVRRGG